MRFKKETDGATMDGFCIEGTGRGTLVSAVEVPIFPHDTFWFAGALVLNAGYDASFPTPDTLPGAGSGGAGQG